MALEKGNEDRSKYYLHYPKPPVFDSKWESHGINVVEWANISKFAPLMHVHWEKTLFWGPWNA